MIKSWKDFILEGYKRSSRGEIIEGTEDQIEDILEKYVPWYDTIDVKMPLYRSVMVGTSIKPYFSYKIIDPKKFVRKPPTTENYYNVIIDNSENWKDYPKRSRSVMTHTLESKTRLYGNKVYRVIPIKENTKCAYIDNDYWMAFENLFRKWPFGSINSLNEMNSSLKNVFNLPKKDYPSDKLKELLSSKNFNVENLSYFANKSLISNWKDRLKNIEKEMSFYDWIDEQIKPEYTSVKLFNYNNQTDLGKYHIEGEEVGFEVWTDEKCLLIDNDILRKLWIRKKNS